MAILSDYGRKARIAMLEKDITMTFIAKECNVSVSYISDIFRGARKGVAQRGKINGILGITESEGA
jgi:transcriptional regulator with XRE-family HTH domain